MSDNENRDLFEQERSAQSELLDELDSLKELLDEEVGANAPVPATVNEIRTVEEYMQFKREADAAGMALDAYLAKRHAEQQGEESITLDYGVEGVDEAVQPPSLGENEISTVQEYMQLKHEADAAGMSLDAYLAQRSAEQLAENAIPTLDEVVAFDDIGEIDDGLDIPTLNEAVEIPTLEEVVEAAPAPASGDSYSLEEVEQLVDSIVQQKLREIKPQLEKQVFDQIRNMLPVDRFHK